MVVRKDIDNSSAVVSVTITREELKPRLDGELKKFRQRAPIKGFRQGQAPIDMVKKLYGPSIFADVLNDMLANRLYDYLREIKLEVLGQPLPSETQQHHSYKISNPEPEYVVHYDIGYVPTFDIKGLGKSEHYERLTVSNLDQLAEDDLQYARKRMGGRSNPDTDIQENDIVRIAARELDGDTPKEGGLETTMTVFVKNVTDEGFRSQLLASKKGDTLRFNPRHIEAQENDTLYRKYILGLEKDDMRTIGEAFEGSIEEVSRVAEAELNEEFYQNYFGGSVSNREEAIEQIKQGIQQFYDVRANAMLMRSFQERLMAQNAVELPEAFLKRWLKATNAGRLTEAQIESEYPAFAENLRWSILRDKIKEMSGQEVTEEDIRAEYVRRVRNYFQVELPENIIESSVQRLMSDKDDVEKTTRDLETDLIFRVIRDQVSVRDQAVSSEEFHATLDAITKQAEADQASTNVLQTTLEEA
jgi:trigger factor